MSARTLVLPIVVLVASLSAVTLAASLVWSGFGTTIDEHYGRGVGLIGDITGDGIEDYAIGAVGFDNWTGRVQVHDGASRAIIATLNGEHAGARLGGRIVSAGDFNCDGVNDFAVASVRWGATGEGKVSVLSGTGPGAVAPLGALFSVTGTTSGDGLGDALSGRLDFNNDGCGDILIGSPWNDEGGANAGKIQVFGGPNGQLLWSTVGSVPERSLGISLGHGDINDDGVADVIAGTFYSSGFGKAYVYSGADGSLLLTKTGTGTRDRFGAVAGSAGDFNRDGIDDFAVAAPGAARFHVYAGGLTPTTMGALIATVSEAAESFAPLGDVNSDGFDDFGAGVPSWKVGSKRYGKVTVYGGGGAISTVVPPSANTDMGYYQSGAAGRLLVGGPGYNKKGAAYMYALP